MSTYNSPRRVIITFLGNRALPTTYRHNEQDYKGNVFAEALRQFTDYDLMLVCTTEEASKTTWPVLETLKDPRVERLDIPTGRNTDEMWETFGLITAKVKQGDIVTFDITHGLRSLPFLVFLFAAYLKAAKNVQIKAIYYGALELGSGGPRPAPASQSDQKTEIPPSPVKPAPVIDLSEFVSMIDWIMATNQFIKLGDGQELAELMKSQTDLSNAIRDTSLALSLSRPLSTMTSAHLLKVSLEDSTNHISTKDKPFDVLKDQVREAYAEFALATPRNDAQLQLNLANQSKMVQWYLKRFQYVQAVTLARELLVTISGFMLGVKVVDLFDEYRRQDLIEAAINQFNADAGNYTFERTPSPLHPFFVNLPQAATIADLYKKLGKIRNDLAHTEMRKKPTPASQIIKDADTLCTQVCSLVDSTITPQTPRQ